MNEENIRRAIRTLHNVRETLNNQSRRTPPSPNQLVNLADQIGQVEVLLHREVEEQKSASAGAAE